MPNVTTIFRHSLLLGLATAWVEPVRAHESAPSARALGGDRSDPAGRVTAWAAAGPWVFAKPAPDAGTTSGFRPFWVQTTEANGAVRTATALYPLFTYRADADTYAWSFLELIKRSGRKDGAPAPQSTLENSAAFEAWPFWFSRRTDDPAESYRALFPVAGTLKRRLGFEALSWKLFPLHVEAQHRGATTTWTPWPIIRKPTVPRTVSRSGRSSVGRSAPASPAMNFSFGRSAPMPPKRPPPMRPRARRPRVNPPPCPSTPASKDPAS